jgi:hypothetical protein
LDNCGDAAGLRAASQAVRINQSLSTISLEHVGNDQA